VIVLLALKYYLSLFPFSMKTWFLFSCHESLFYNYCLFSNYNLFYNCNLFCAVAQLVEVLRYKLEGRGFDSWWCHWNFLLT
jgi:hypothetical protein